MPIISVEIMKTVDEREMQKATKEKQIQKGARGTEAIAKQVYSYRIISLIFLNIYTPPQHALTHNSLPLK